MSDKWISVEQELPPIGKEVMTFSTGGLMRQDHTTKYMGQWRASHPCWTHGDTWFMRDHEGNVTHWQPALSPPEPKADKKEETPE